jgi:two-component system sensor histidine kinase ChiS
MIYMVDGVRSWYSAGFILHMIGIAIAGSLGLKEVIVYISTTVIMYVVTITIKGIEPGDARTLIVQIMFLSTSGIMFCYMSYLHTMTVRKNFILRKELEENHLALKEEKEREEYFIANISHELRTPLMLLLHLNKVVQDNPSDIVKVMEASMQVNNNAMRLLNEINKLLNLTYERMVDIPFKEVNINQVLVNYLAMIEEPLARNGYRLNYDIDRYECGYIMGDVSLLETALTQLLSNARKFSQPGSTIVVRGEIEPGSAYYSLEIQDHGQGIPEDKLAKVFERFYQVDSSSTKEKAGMGIGLPVVQSIVQRHGGQVKIVSEVGQGTTVFVRLPLFRTALYDEPINISPIHDTDDFNKSVAIYELSRTSPTFSHSQNLDYIDTQNTAPEIIEDCIILVCEDDPNIAAMTRQYWLSSFNKVFFAIDGQEALEKIHRLKPNIVLLDLQMPKLTGIDVLRSVDRSQIPFTRFIMFTATPGKQTLEQAFISGAHDYIEKGSLQDDGEVQLKVRIRSNAETSIAIQQRDKALSEINRAHQKITQLAKLRMIETIASGLLHEVNNPLAIAREMICFTIEEPNDRQNIDLNKAVECLDKISQLIDRLRRFSRSDGVGKIDKYNVSAIVSQAISDAYLSSDINVNVDIPSDLEINTSYYALTQILQTILRNADQQIQNTQDPQISIRLMEEEGYAGHIVLSITDSGPGIPENLLQRIFDPFFTTKDVNEGSGLGLYVAQSLALKLGGIIHARNVKGSGAQFNITIPLDSDANPQMINTLTVS